MLFRLFLFYLELILIKLVLFFILMTQSIKKLVPGIALDYLKLVILKKLWTWRHAFCYIRVDREFPVNVNVLIGRG